MTINLLKNRSKFLYLAVFVVLGFVLLQFPVNNLAGTRAKLTFFDMFYPVSGAFLGSIWGMAAVGLMQVANLAFHGFDGVKATSLLAFLATVRLLPMITGVAVFSKPDKRLLTLPLLAIIAFLANPVGREAWYFTLLWVIPFAVWPFRERFLAARSLASTFSSHSVGGAIWVWAFPTTAAFWTGLVPVVILERSIFALGISASFILMTNILGYLSAKNLLPKGVTLAKKYLIVKK
ncbi:hypothetical protein HYW40_01185 [Candidatus Curtissbacteria bacterium]|nr:hypothetical protein [Candidatus Curtissbacteria bacterium]